VSISDHAAMPNGMAFSRVRGALLLPFCTLFLDGKIQPPPANKFFPPFLFSSGVATDVSLLLSPRGPDASGTGYPWRSFFGLEFEFSFDPPPCFMESEIVFLPMR